MNLKDTRIQMGGVMRCCLASVAEEYDGGGLLRGAGNAIVPQVAAQFVQAFLDVA